MNNLLQSIFITLSFIFIIGCGTDDNGGGDTNTTTAYTVSGDTSGKNVFIIAQGGPSTKLAGDYYKKMLYDDINDSFLAMSGVTEEKKAKLLKIKATPRIYVHQKQTINPQIFRDNNITFMEAKNHAVDSTKMFFNVIKKFKDLNKTIYVIGASYGAFLVQDYLYRYSTEKSTDGSNLVDGYALAIGRLDMPETVWKSFSEGKPMIFDENGENPTSSTNEAAGMEGGDTTVSQNMNKLAAAYGFQRYTELLKDINLTNVSYAHGGKDTKVGRLSDEEVAFLKRKSPQKIIYSSDLNHSEVLEQNTLKTVVHIFK